MTLQQLSPQYAAGAMAIQERIRQLTLQIQQSDDPAEIQVLNRRINDLRPLERQTRELANLTARYYDRRYRPYAQYSL
ncbi:MAG: hypothetical protein KBS74_02445 [Clostridiales bacterium]|nr:hypothetical protein [Candidatus Cacconaster stercorequi]